MLSQKRGDALRDASMVQPSAMPMLAAACSLEFSRPSAPRSSRLHVVSVSPEKNWPLPARAGQACAKKEATQLPPRDVSYSNSSAAWAATRGDGRPSARRALFLKKKIDASATSTLSAIHEARELWHSGQAGGGGTQLLARWYQLPSTSFRAMTTPMRAIPALCLGDCRRRDRGQVFATAGGGG